MRFRDIFGSQWMGEEMESKGAMDGPGYEPMGDGRKREGDYRGYWRGHGLKLARILETLATTAASTP